MRDDPPSTGLSEEPPPCLVSDEDLWFSPRPEDAEQAKVLCRRCPIMHECRRGALERQEPWGVWGGAIFVDGVIVARKRSVGRPRKDSLPAA